MVVRLAEAEWRGGIQEGGGRLKAVASKIDAPYSVGSRMSNEQGGNPEELLGAAHAGCFSMALAAQLKEAGFTADRIHTTAKVHLDKHDKEWAISSIDLDTEAQVPGLSADDFRKRAETAKTTCPVSRALSGVEIRLNAHLI